MILADVFEKFRRKRFSKKIFWKNSIKNYGLCPSHYLSAQGLSCDAMIKMKNNELDLIPDSDMNIFFKKGTRGRKANNKYLKSYYPNQE